MSYKEENTEYEYLIHEPRPIYHHHRMETAHRAKQFAPFAALKGFENTVQSKDGTFWQMELLDRPMEELEHIIMDDC